MLDSEFVYEALLRWNYFPNQKENSEELPPIFTTRNLVPSVAEKLTKLPCRKGGYDHVEYFLTRYNNVPRLLSIPHPLAYVHLAKCIKDNWTAIEQSSASSVSQISPYKHQDGRLISMNYGDFDSIDEILTQGPRYRVHADISNCFNSIYTHAIPWALVGHKEAKAKSGWGHNNEWFNLLDKCQRMVKRNETNGVPIGPATSNIVVECILSKIDEVLLGSHNYKYQRFIDDYICYCFDHEQAEQFIRDLRNELHKYKLDLNLTKTKVVELPDSESDLWILDLRTRLPQLREKDGGHWYLYSDVSSFIEYAVRLNKSAPDGSVVKYAVKSVINRVHCDDLRVFLKYLIHLSYYFPGMLPYISNILARESEALNCYENELNFIVVNYAKDGKSDGMVWGIYYLNKSNLKIHESTAKAVIASKDCMAIVSLSLSRGHNSEIASFISEINKRDNFERDRYWLLFYQEFFSGRIENMYNDPAFRVLKDHDVSFIDRADYQSALEAEFEAEKVRIMFDFVDETLVDGVTSNDL
ncbi:antiviral reverse transcriptase Drt4 [Thalassolituus oleivorans]|uniref:antiviral reverse transcriptase Drt4 n=1 Tax=Thalassolituus oleivorans TaxID=187493 RepID=UPI0024091FA5|nr:antiviral reverse transcriptase Drt4 [Thalassolituus oleivorans]MDF1641292.1 RNA-directed DNA polymerase [Thalassolituus oleivorans]